MSGSNMGIPYSNTPPSASLTVGQLVLSKQTAQLCPISFKLPRPGCWWLAGPSGAGKSLLLESLAGFHAEASGSIRVNLGASSHEVSNLAPELRSIALMPQRWRLFPHWTVARNLRFAANLSKASQTRITALAEHLAVDHLLKRSTRALSGGETQRIVLIQTLLSPARVLLLDEPLSAVDVALQSKVLDLLQEESEKNHRTCLIAVHHAPANYPMQGTFLLKDGKLLANTKSG
jgi:molybdate/tungstate transport system ATP-binding protein